MSRLKNLTDRLKSLFVFTPSERRGILWLLPLLAVFSLIIHSANRPRFETAFLESVSGVGSGENIYSGTVVAGRNISSHPSTDITNAGREITHDPVGELFSFDPNTAVLQEFVKLGIDTRTAAGIIKYRERGKIFEIPEDLAACYGITADMYARLEPYIVIGEGFSLKKNNAPRNGTGRPHAAGGVERLSSGGKFTGGTTAPKFTPPDGKFDPNVLTKEQFVALGFSAKQAEVIINFRTSIGGFRTAADFGKSYVVSDEAMEVLGPYIEIRDAGLHEQNTGPTSDQETPGKDVINGNEIAIPVEEPASGLTSGTLQKQAGPIEINKADSALLRSVNGIGEVLVVRILEYRRRLGGFADISQLAEIQGMTEQNFNRIAEQITVDSYEIQKIDINFASHKILVDRLGNHPYVTDRMLRKILKERQLKGGWSSPGDMVKENIMTQKEAERLAPYLIFNAE